jgi:hypothetical protein
LRNWALPWLGGALANPRERRKPLICPEFGRLIQVD